MKRWVAITVVALVVICALPDLIREFYTNDTLNFFSSEPRRLLYVAAIAVAGGLVALTFSRLSGPSQRSAQLFGWGSAASLLTAFCGYSIYQSVSLSTVIVANSGAGWLPLVPLLLSAMAAYLWFEFCRAWQARVTDSPGHLTTKELKCLPRD
jgi:hypothetical protein